jgi:hypothetical protein
MLQHLFAFEGWLLFLVGAAARCAVLKALKSKYQRNSSYRNQLKFIETGHLHSLDRMKEPRSRFLRDTFGPLGWAA